MEYLKELSNDELNKMYKTNTRALGNDEKSELMKNIEIEIQSRIDLYNAKKSKK